ncbi:hypothetical protein TNCV_388301 [Trichonephila clavipes]|nr:hypothetical protein TNCV_388301 [Trichonephila clavipes]
MGLKSGGREGQAIGLSRPIYLPGYKIANFDSFLRNLLIKEKAEIPRFLDNGTTWHDLAPEEKDWWCRAGRGNAVKTRRVELAVVSWPLPKNYSSRSYTFGLQTVESKISCFDPPPPLPVQFLPK